MTKVVINKGGGLVGSPPEKILEIFHEKLSQSRKKLQPPTLISQPHILVINDRSLIQHNIILPLISVESIESHPLISAKVMLKSVGE